jgi:hypothetical protein
MPKLLSRFLKSPEAKKKAHRVAGVILLLVAAINWWIVIENGATAARVIGGVAASVAAILELFLPKKRGLLRWRRSAPGPS